MKSSIARAMVAGMATLVWSAPTIQAQKAVIENSSGTIEIHGLRSWTVEMLNDSLRKHVGFDFNSASAHACAAELRYKLRFADASAIVFPPSPETGKAVTMVTVTEPQDSARIKYRNLPHRDTTGGNPAWESMRKIVAQRPRAFQAAAASALVGTDTSTLPRDMWSDWWVLRETWAFLEANKTPAAHEAAIAALESESNIRDRQIAAAILVNFGNNDATWQSLSQALLEREGSAKFTALVVMRTLLNAGHKPSDWKVIAPAVHAVLDGTSQFMMLNLVALLNKIEPGPELAGPFLKNGGTMLVAYASSDIQRVREPSLALLRSLRGKNLGTNAKAWSKWVASLQ